MKLFFQILDKIGLCASLLAMLVGGLGAFFSETPPSESWWQFVFIPGFFWTIIFLYIITMRRDA